jgi:hypothetical protein
MFRNHEVARAPQIVAPISPIPKRKRVGNQVRYKLFVGMLGAGESVKFIQIERVKKISAQAVISKVIQLFTNWDENEFERQYVRKLRGQKLILKPLDDA